MTQSSDIRKEIFSDAEKEILILKATMESINSMVNCEVLTLNHADPDSSIQFKNSIHQKYFNIIVLDFLHSKIFRVDKNCIEALQTIFSNSVFNIDVATLKNATNNFREWLDRYVEYEHNGETREIWFPSIDQKMALKIKRSEYIEICGNISKHNPLGLDRQAGIIKRIFASNSVTIELTQALLIMDEFYQQFHGDQFSYHSSAIAEFLNNIRWGIYEYLQPLYMKSVNRHWDEHLKINAPQYIYPDNIVNSYVRDIFWNLMNDVRSEPYMPRFVVTKFLKMRY